MNKKKRILIAVGVVILIAIICFIAFNVIGLNNNNIVEKGILKKSKTINFKSNKNYEHINFEIIFLNSNNEIKNNKVYYKILDPKEVVVYKGTITNNKSKTQKISLKGKKGIWKIKLNSENKKATLEYRCHIKTGNFK